MKFETVKSVLEGVNDILGHTGHCPQLFTDCRAMGGAMKESTPDVMTRKAEVLSLGSKQGHVIAFTKYSCT
jgi:hypothetical protein